jgi:hypothetical protein
VGHALHLDERAAPRRIRPPTGPVPAAFRLARQGRCPNPPSGSKSAESACHAPSPKVDRPAFSTHRFFTSLRQTPRGFLAQASPADNAGRQKRWSAGKSDLQESF